MKLKTFRNSFHNTEVRARVPADCSWMDIQIMAQGERKPHNPNQRLEKRIRKSLCGMSDCSCGTVTHEHVGGDPV